MKMRASKKITVSTKIDRARWQRAKSKVDSDIDEIALFEIIQRDLQNEPLILRYKKIIEEDKNKIKVLEKLSSENKEQSKSLKKELNDAEKRLNALERRIQTLKAEKNEVMTKTVIKEKIIYKENTQPLDELRLKRDKLQKKLWQKEVDIQKIKKENEQFKRQIKDYNAKKLNETAILVTLDDSNKGASYAFAYEWLNRGEFNKLNRNMKEFCRYKKISTPGCVIKTCDETISEKSFFQLPLNKHTFSTSSRMEINGKE